MSLCLKDYAYLGLRNDCKKYSIAIALLKKQIFRFTSVLILLCIIIPYWPGYHFLAFEVTMFKTSSADAL